MSTIATKAPAHTGGKKIGSNPAAATAMVLFFIVLAILIIIPLYALVLGTFKGGAEFQNKNVTHRIVKAPYKDENDDYYLVTRGDANNVDDPPILFSNVKFKFLSKLEFLNKAFELFLSPAGLLIFIAALIMIYFDELLPLAKVLTGNYDPEENEEYREEIERERMEEEKRRKEEELRKYKRANWKKYDNTSKRKKKNRKKNKKKERVNRFADD